MKKTFAKLTPGGSFTILNPESEPHYLYTKLDLTARDKEEGKANAVMERHKQECMIADDTAVLELL